MPKESQVNEYSDSSHEGLLLQNGQGLRLCLRSRWNLLFAWGHDEKIIHTSSVIHDAIRMTTKPPRDPDVAGVDHHHRDIRVLR